MEFDLEKIYHVVPLNDLREHDASCEMVMGLPLCRCKCDPKYDDTEPPGMVVIHNSYDGREGVEWANEILK